ncbi:MAG: L,D-transpeptidase family protein [Planctomycetota bacterium]
MGDLGRAVCLAFLGFAIAQDGSKTSSPEQGGSEKSSEKSSEKAAVPTDPRFTGHPAAEKRLRASAKAADVPYPLEEVSLTLRKSERELTLFSKGKVVKRYAVALGFAPAGHKHREGDGKTPEGDYYLCTRNNKSRYHLFLGISYPGPKDAARGLAAKQIDERIAKKVTATKAPATPPWQTPLGGAVGIHGKGGRAAGDWTLGCVAVENPEMDELWIACGIGVPIRIEP